MKEVAADINETQRQYDTTQVSMFVYCLPSLCMQKYSNLHLGTKLCFVVKYYYSRPLHQHVSCNMGANGLSDMSLVG